MKFRCYSCTATLGRVPGIDAFNESQAVMLDSVEGNIKRYVLSGTSLEGLSSGSFCEFCLMVALGLGYIPNQSEWDDKLVEKAPSHCNKSAWVHRTLIARGVEGDLSREIDSMLMCGIQYVPYTCQHPKCDSISGWDLPVSVASRVKLCANHEGLDIGLWLQNPIVKAAFVVSMINHDFLVCGKNGGCAPCEKLYGDHIEAERERYFQELYEEERGLE